MLSEKGNPEYKSLNAVLKAMRLSLAVTATPKRPKRKVKTASSA
ncbi:MAG: hypothetical protein OEY64_00960 [Nitrospinota bacterium]|nr:hypothetical protein [Nitrospinota bacterium]